VRDEIKDPVSGNQGCNEDRATDPVLQNKIGDAQHHAPAQLSYQTVRNRIRCEIQRRCGHKAWSDSHLLNAQQQQKRPQDIGKLSGKN
jgi:hypothetical protein